MWPVDYEVSDQDLHDWFFRCQNLIGELATFSVDVADVESKLPYTQPSPFCGALQQAQNALNHLAIALDEITDHRRSAERSEASHANGVGPGDVDDSIEVRAACPSA